PPEDVDVEPDVLSLDVRESELGDARAGVEGWEPLGVLADRAVAHDFDDNVRRAFDLGGGGDVAQAAGAEGLPEHDDVVGLDGEGGETGNDPGAVDEDLSLVAVGDQGMEGAGEGYFDGAVGMQVFRAHVDLKVAPEEVDPPGFLERRRAGGGRNPEAFFELKGVLAGNGGILSQRLTQQRELKVERSAVPRQRRRGGLEADRAAHGLDQGFADAQAEAGAAFLAGGGGVGLGEAGEDPRPEIFRDARSMVAD